jgi:hypothetical protein
LVNIKLRNIFSSSLGVKYFFLVPVPVYSVYFSVYFLRLFIEPLHGSPASFTRITFSHHLPRLLLRSLVIVRSFTASFCIFALKMSNRQTTSCII